MKQNETDYLNKLFAFSSDLSDEIEVEIPQQDLPAGLTQSLYEIAESSGSAKDPIAASAKRATVLSFPKFASVAASLFVAVLGFQFYQQQQTLKRLEEAQTDLATAIQYLAEANRIARNQVIDSLNDNIKKAGVEPAMEIGRDALRDSIVPKSSDHEPQETQIRHRSL